MADVITKKALDDLYEVCTHPPQRTVWETCPTCEGRMGIPQQITWEDKRKGKLIICPTCLGLGKVPTSANEHKEID